jgi:hypothetical protein
MYPHFKGDFVIAYGDPFPKAYIDQTFSAKLAHTNLEFEITERKTIDFATEGNWISDSSALIFFVYDNLVCKHFEKSTEGFIALMDTLPDLIQFFPALQRVLTN